MHLIYVLLSPTFGMHQYPADLANRAAEGALQRSNVPTFQRWNVSLVTTAGYPRDRYSPAVSIHTPVTSRGTGFAPEGLDLSAYRRTLSAIRHPPSAIGHQPPVTSHQPVVHLTGVHLWNVALVRALRRQGIPVVHTLHDLHPHAGVRFGWLIRVWNRLIIASGAHILVHGRRYRDELLARGLPGGRVTCTPLLHGFWGYQEVSDQPSAISDRPSAIGHPPTVLFFGRLEAYKGLDTLLAAWQRVAGEMPDARLIIAGPRAPGLDLPPLSSGVELRAQRIGDDEACDLFRSASLLVLPYRDATQSALVAAAYTFAVPALVTAAGALGEYVVPGETGWVVPPDDPAALASALRDALGDLARLRAFGNAGQSWYATQRETEQALLVEMYTRLHVCDLGGEAAT
jgi:glycosyltransferase involved in cell wall biosynthesis